MRRLICSLLLVSVVGCATVPVSRLSEGQAIADGDVTEMMVHGLHVIVKTLPRQPVTSCQLYLRGGANNWTAQTAGIEKLALATALSGGTQSLPKPAFQAKLAALGTQLAAQSTEESAVVGFTALDRTFAPSFALLADALLHPALPEPDVELQRSLMLSELAQEEDDPDALLMKSVHETFYAGLPYAWLASGTVPSVKALTRPQLVDHLAKLRETSRLLLVVVGNVTAADVKAAVEAQFADVPVGSYRAEPFRGPTFDAPHLTTVDRPLPTNYVLAAFPGPTFGDPSLAVGIVAMSALHDRLFEEVRTKRNLSYAPGAGLSPHALGQGYIYVTAVDVPKTLQVTHDVLREMQTGHIDPVQLEGSKRIFLTGFLMQEEPPGGQAELLARAQLVGGDYRLARDLPKAVAAVTPAQVAAFLAKVKDLQIVVVGGAKGLPSGPLE